MLGGQHPLPMTKVADHLVGRAAELEAIDRALGELCDGQTARLVIEGEPGIGKTRLLAELAKRADTRGCTVLGGARQSSSVTCRSGFSSTPSTSTSPDWTRGSPRP
jgi:predicted ATP-dependent serine protease